MKKPTPPDSVLIDQVLPAAKKIAVKLTDYVAVAAVTAAVVFIAAR